MNWKDEWERFTSDPGGIYLIALGIISVIVSIFLFSVII